ncbi:MAG: hypothetical protein QGG40_19240, partial [Myxococcota bacterium]|nr:hypothetical protein [Myxococcota bacterium]
TPGSRDRKQGGLLMAWERYLEAASDGLEQLRQTQREAIRRAADLVAERLLEDARFGLTGNVGTR